VGRDAGRDAELVKLVGALGRQLEQDVERHFQFEERELFRRMREAGEADIAALLADEHEAIRVVAREVLPLTTVLAYDERREAAGVAAGHHLGCDLAEYEQHHSHHDAADTEQQGLVQPAVPGQGEERESEDAGRSGVDNQIAEQERAKQAAGVGEQVVNAANGAVKDVEEWAGDGADTVRDMIRSQPLAAIALSMSAGAALSFLLRR
jgi:hypothetical protein